MDIGEWLRSIGLGQYEAAFRDNEIDDEVFRSLTAEDLKDLGVTLVGHRRKVLTAIADLSASAAASPAAIDTERLPPTAKTTQIAAERRQVTVFLRPTGIDSHVARGQAGIDGQWIRAAVMTVNRRRTLTPRSVGTTW